MKFPKIRRSTYIVNKSLQYRFLATILLYCFITVVFIFVYLFVPEFIKLNDNSVSMEVKAAAADRVLMLHARIWPAVISLIIIFGIHSIFLFHRIVGPLYRFGLAFDKIRKGDLKFRVKIREKDYLHDEEEAFNNMINSIVEKLKDIKTHSLDSLNSLYELEKQSSDWKETDKERLTIHRGNIVKLADAINLLQF